MRAAVVCAGVCRDAVVRASLCPGAVVRAAVVGVVFAGPVLGCAGPPWYMGQPLDGRRSDEGESADPPASRLRDVARDEQARGRHVLELRALLGLQRRAALRPLERTRLAELLLRRAATWAKAGHPVAWAADLRAVEALADGDDRSPGLDRRAAELDRRAAELAAGDFWLSVGEADKALAAFRAAFAAGAVVAKGAAATASVGVAAVAAGAADPAVRLRLDAAAGLAPAASTNLDDLEFAVRTLPLRALGPFVQLYLNQGGLEPATLARARRAAEILGRPELAARIDAVAPAAWQGDEAGEAASGASSDLCREPVDWEQRLLGDAPVTLPLLTLMRACPEALGRLPRPAWHARLVAEEDRHDPDGLVLVSRLELLAGNVGGARRWLVDSVYFSEDRAAARDRLQALWQSWTEAALPWPGLAASAR